MRNVNITYVLVESIIGMYMLLSVLLGNPSLISCLAQPYKFTSSLFFYVFIPFYFMRMIAIVFSTS